MNTILGILKKIQTDLKAPKKQYNNFGGYKYRKAEDILDAIKPYLKMHDCTLVISDTIKCVGNRNYVEATVTLYSCKDHTDSVTVTASAREEETKKGMDQSQITGASSSYARKYALNGLFCIDDTHDSDSTNTHGKEPAQQQKQAPDISNPREYVFQNGELKGQKLCEVKDVGKLETVLNAYGAQMPEALRNAISEHLNVITQANVSQTKESNMGGF